MLLKKSRKGVFMVRVVRRLEVSIPDGTKNHYPDGMLKGSISGRVWYPVVCEKTVMRKKKDDSEVFEDLVLGVIGKDGFLCWVPAYTVNIREDIAGDSYTQLVFTAIEALKRINPILPVDYLDSIPDAPGELSVVPGVAVVDLPY